MTYYVLRRMKFPFEGTKWVLYNKNSSSEPFGMYSRKADAKKDAKQYGLKIQEEYIEE